jgi:hypothetical protein
MQKSLPKTTGIVANPEADVAKAPLSRPKGEENEKMEL